MILLALVHKQDCHAGTMFYQSAMHGIICMVSYDHYYNYVQTESWPHFLLAMAIHENMRFGHEGRNCGSCTRDDALGIIHAGHDHGLST